MSAVSPFTRELLTSLAEDTCDEALELPDLDLCALEFDWRFWARPNQIAPVGVWTVWIILAGRGWGKTRTGAEAIREVVDEARKTGEPIRIALVGATIGDVREVMLDGESGLLNIFPEHQRPRYIPSRSKVVFPGTNAIAFLYSAEKPRKLRGPQHHIGWCDELAAWQHLKETWANLRFGLRLGKNPRVIVTTTPRPIEQIIEWEDEVASGRSTSVRLTRGTTYDNRSNLPDQFFEEIIRAYEGTRLGEQELQGRTLHQLEGALFQRDWIRRSIAVERFSRIAVAIDPAISKRNDETGIVVVGRHGDRVQVLEDLSGHWSPNQWAQKARDAYERWGKRTGSIAIVGEVNRGGDLIKSTLRNYETANKKKPARFIAVRAFKQSGKEARAEPIAALYEQGRVEHVHTFEALERQMCTFDPREQDELRSRKKADSPDRLDALVWGISGLGLHVAVARRGSVSFDLSLPTRDAEDDDE